MNSVCDVIRDYNVVRDYLNDTDLSHRYDDMVTDLVFLRKTTPYTRFIKEVYGEIKGPAADDLINAVEEQHILENTKIGRLLYA